MLARMAQYFVVGGVSAVVDISFFFVFAKLLGFNYLVVATIGFVIATLVNYALSIKFVFTSGVRFGKRKEITLVYLVSAAGLAVNLLVLYLAVSVAGLELMLSKVIATATVFLWNFLTRNYFIFRRPARSSS